MGSGVAMGTILVVNTGAWPLAWIGIELNLIRFIPIAIIKEQLKK